MKWLVAVLLLAIVAVVAVAQNPQRRIGQRIPYSASVQYGFPREVWEFLENNAWGDFHMAFHMARHYYRIGTQARQFLDSNGIAPGPFQEGDPNNGVEFLAMHRAMMEYLRQRFGNLPVNGDPDGRRTVSECLDGWRTDDEVIRGLTRVGGDVARFRSGLANINNFRQFRTEDEFGLFIQTGMRLVGQIDPNNPSRRQYTTDSRPGAGFHNWLHGQLQDDNSPITVGDPRTNLPNMMFWRIHGWIEAKWKAFEASRPRTQAENELYQGFITQFRAHMIAMGGGHSNPVSPPPAPSTTSSRTRRTTTRRTRAPRSGWFLQGLTDDLHNAERRVVGDAQRLAATAERFAVRDRVFNYMERVRRNIRSIHRGSRIPWQLVLHLRQRRRWFRNNFYQCHALSEGTITDRCPEGNRSPDQPDPRLGETEQRN